MVASTPLIAWRISIRRILSITILIAITLYLIIVAAKGIAATFNQEDFPEALAVKMDAFPVIFPIHMLTGGLALLLVPLTYIARRTPFHRWLGVITAILVIISGITALPVAWFAPVTFWSGAGFMMQAIAWLTLLGLGLYSLWKRRFRAHRYYMLLMAAVTSGAVFFRIWLALWAILGDFRYYRLAYSIDAWIGWLLPLTLAIILLKRPNLR